MPVVFCYAIIYARLSSKGLDTSNLANQCRPLPSTALLVLQVISSGREIQQNRLCPRTQNVTLLLEHLRLGDFHHHFFFYTMACKAHGALPCCHRRRWGGQPGQDPAQTATARLAGESLPRLQSQLNCI